MEKCMKTLVNKNIKVCRDNNCKKRNQRRDECECMEKNNIFQFDLQLSNDGSGIGAALSVAAEVLSTQENKKSPIKNKPRRRSQL
jgi:hypothetical protein